MLAWAGKFRGSSSRRIQLERLAVLGISPILVRRDAGVLWYLGALTSEGDRVDNDSRPVTALTARMP